MVLADWLFLISTPALVSEYLLPSFCTKPCCISHPKLICKLFVSGNCMIDGVSRCNNLLQSCRLCWYGKKYPSVCLWYVHIFSRTTAVGADLAVYTSRLAAWLGANLANLSTTWILMYKPPLLKNTAITLLHSGNLPVRVRRYFRSNKQGKKILLLYSLGLEKPSNIAASLVLL